MLCLRAASHLHFHMIESPTSLRSTNEALQSVQLEELSGTEIAVKVARVVTSGHLPIDDGTFRAPAEGARAVARPCRNLAGTSMQYPLILLMPPHA